MRLAVPSAHRRTTANEQINGGSVNQSAHPTWVDSSKPARRTPPQQRVPLGLGYNGGRSPQTPFSAQYARTPARDGKHGWHLGNETVAARQRNSRAAAPL